MPGRRTLPKWSTPSSVPKCASAARRSESHILSSGQESPMAEFDVDLFVIGGGSGGGRAARIAAGHGARVMIAEEYRMGGTCVIRGCVPKKLFVMGSHVHQEIEDAAGFGWTIPQATFDWPTLIRNKDKEIARLEAAYTTNVEKSGAEIVK